MDKYFFTLIIIVCFFLIFAMIYLFFRYHDRMTVCWSVAGILFVAEFFLDAGYHHFLKNAMPPFIQFIDWTSLIAGSFFFMWGTYFFTGNRLPRGWFFFYAACLPLIIANIHHSTQLIISLLYFYQGWGQAWAGIMLMLDPTLRGPWKYTAGSALIIWGWGIDLLLQNEQPGLTQPYWLSPLGYLLAIGLGSIAVIGLYVLYLQKNGALDQDSREIFNYLTHELKNQAMTIHNYSQSILDNVYPQGTLRESVTVINNEANRMAKWSRDLLSLTKTDNLLVSSESRKSPLELDLLIRDCLDCFEWRRKDVIWEVELEPTVIRGDREQWVIAVKNLLDNQERYARRGIAITLKKDENRATLRFHNDGPPIQNDVLPTLFQDFRAGINGEYGLGLVIVRKIVEGHSGAIRAVNEPDGVSFLITLPLIHQGEEIR